MTLRTQLIRHMKAKNTAILGVELQRVLFKTNKGGYFSPGSISRECRRLAEDGRFKSKRTEKNLVIYKIRWTEHELFHKRQQEI